MIKESQQDSFNPLLQRKKAEAILKKAKDIESQKKGYKFVRIDNNTRVYKKV